MPIFNFLNVKEKKAVKVEAETYKEAEKKYAESQGKVTQKIRKPRKPKTPAVAAEATPATPA